MENVETALRRLERYCRSQDYAGWDLFDGLNSEVLRATPLDRSRLVRLIWIQAFKRSPVNLRRVLRVPKGENPKGLALFASAYMALGDMNQGKNLLDRVMGLCCAGYAGMSWGYNFDWQSRAFFVKEGTPNLVTTVFVANSCLDYFESSGEERYLAFADRSCEFMLRNMVLHEDESTLCFRYIPGENAVIHNAYMLGAALLGRVYKHNGNPRLLEASTKAMQRAIQAMRPDGAWPYGERHHHRFVDNFHTGFNLVSLKQWMEDTGDTTWNQEIRAAYDYWLNNFFLANGCPKYYDTSLYPIDVHCSAQGVVTCLRLREFDNRSLDLAQRIADWTISNLQDDKGYFYCQKKRWFTNKIPYVRWAQAWMLYALALLSAHMQSSKVNADTQLPRYFSS